MRIWGCWSAGQVFQPRRAADPHKRLLGTKVVASRPVFNTVVALLQPTMAGCPTPARNNRGVASVSALISDGALFSESVPSRVSLSVELLHLDDGLFASRITVAFPWPMDSPNTAARHQHLAFGLEVIATQDVLTQQVVPFLGELGQ